MGIETRNKIHAAVSVDGPTGAILGAGTAAQGIRTVTRTAAGIYELVFEQELDGLHCADLVGCDQIAPSNMQYSTNHTSDLTKILTFASGGAAADPATFTYAAIAFLSESP